MNSEFLWIILVWDLAVLLVFQSCSLSSIFLLNILKFLLCFLKYECRKKTAVQHWSSGNVNGIEKKCEAKGCYNLCIKEFHEFFQWKCCSEICVHFVLSDSGVLFRALVLCYTGSSMLEDSNEVRVSP